MSITVTTNNQWRFLVGRYEVPASVLKSEFDWLDEDEGMSDFFSYRGRWYHVSEFMRLDGVGFGEDLPGWQGYYSDSFFSGVVIRLDRDGECIKVGTYIS